MRKKKITSQFKSNTNNIAFTTTISSKPDLAKIVANTDLSYKKNYNQLLEAVELESYV